MPNINELNIPDPKKDELNRRRQSRIAEIEATPDDDPVEADKLIPPEHRQAFLQAADRIITSCWGTPAIYNKTTNEFIDCWKESDEFANWDNTVIRLLTFAKVSNVPL